MRGARETLAANPEQAVPLLQEFGVDVQAALDELRDLAHGLYPPVLADHGLAEALRALARRSPVPVETGIVQVGRLDPLTESAVYFCCSEALQNAAKHAGPDARILLGLRRGDGAVEFEVHDDGPGIDPSMQVRIFDPFFTTRRGSMHTGLGLAICYGVVRNHGGEIRVRSQPGEGATFTVELPATGSQLGQ